MKIVIVEDEAPIREGIAKILDKINPEYELVGKAGDGAAGYELVMQTNPDLVILDIQMPKMNGLSMLKKLRNEQIHCKALILSAYSDFNYAKQAIELGIENYLLKPIKIGELKRALRQIEETLDLEESQEKAFSVDGIFLGCLNGQLKPDKQFHSMTRLKYGFTVEEPAQVFLLWLGEKYEEQRQKAREFLENVGEHTVKFASIVLEADAWKVLLMVIYRSPEDDSVYHYFKKSVVPALCSNLESPVVCIWQRAEKILELPETVSQMMEEREWNLVYKKGSLLRKEEIEKLKITPFKYPVEIEDKACHALKRGDKKILPTFYKELFTYIRDVYYNPAEMKKAVIRFSWAIANEYRDIQKIDSDVRIQKILHELSEAVSWKQIEDNLITFFQIVDFDFEEEEESVSVLVQKAQQLIKKYYDQGITLEEVANKLFVSEEYLSTQFKKETGVSFSGTIRKYRIDKVKSLLLDTHLKLNQIAELAGYSDPKYMSKVFKEEVGMLPNEYRKSVH